MRKILNIISVGSAVSLFAVAASACGSSASSDDADVFSIVVTTSVHGDIVAAALGADTNDAISIDVVMPAGADPHDFSASAKQAESMENADLLVVNGLGLEEGLDGIIDAVADSGTTVFAFTDHLDLLSLVDEDEDHDDEDHDEDEDHADEDEDHADEDHDDEDHDDEDHDDEDHDDEDHADEDEDHADGDHADENEDHADEDEDHADEDHADEDEDHADEDEDHADEDEDHADEDHDDEDHADEDHDDEDHADHDHGDEDPHVWTDPIGLIPVVEALGEAVEAGVADADPIHESVERYIEQLVAIDAEIVETLDAIPEAQRVLVTNHDSFGYFADRYGFEVVGTVIPSLTTNAEASSSALDALAEVMAERNVKAVFAETTESDRLATALADQVGDDVVVVDLYTGSLGPADSGAETYLTMMTTNATSIANALS